MVLVFTKDVGTTCVEPQDQAVKGNVLYRYRGSEYL